MDEQDGTTPAGGGDEARAERDIVSRSDLALLVMLRDQIQKIRIAESNRAAASARMITLSEKADEFRAEGIEGESLVEALMAVKVKGTLTSELVARHVIGQEQNIEQEAARVQLHQGYTERLSGIESEIERSVKPFVQQHPAWFWLKEIKGVAETSAALVLGHIDISRAPTVSALWRFAGFAVIDGKSERPKAGQKNAYNSRLRTMVWRLISLQVRLAGPYDKVYRAAKHTYLTTRGPGSGFADANGKEWTLAHCDMAARRKAAKLFLSHLWEVWREAEGLPTKRPFITEVEGHDYIDPYAFIGMKRPAAA